jgi:hypothetical protein
MKAVALRNLKTQHPPVVSWRVPIEASFAIVSAVFCSRYTKTDEMGGSV